MQILTLEDETLVGSFELCLVLAEFLELKHSVCGVNLNFELLAIALANRKLDSSSRISHLEEILWKFNF